MTNSKKSKRTSNRAKTKTASRASKAFTVNTNYARVALGLLALNVLFTGYVILKLTNLIPLP